MEDFLDFLGSLYDDATDVLSSFWDSLTDWFSDAWNWLTGFFYKAYACILSWFDALGDWAEEELKKLNVEKIVIFTPTSPIDSAINQAIKENEEKHGSMSLDELKRAGQKYKQYGNAEIKGITMNRNQITGSSAFDAEVVENPNGFNQFMQERDGMAVLKN